MSGRVRIPGSKSHTIRAVAIAALAEGVSRIEEPLVSSDTQAALDAYSAAGAAVAHWGGDLWVVRGTGGEITAPDGVVDVGNSGTTLRVAMGSFALMREGVATLTGDEQIQRRPAGPLIDSLNDLGADVRSTGGGGCAPFEVRGRLSGGRTTIEAVTSQYLTSLLLNAPLADGDSHIDVTVLNEAPYVRITLSWLESLGINLSYSDDLSEFDVPGGQSYPAFHRRIPADFSSATFFLAAGAIGENEVTLEGLDMSDPQGDKAVVDYVAGMGASVAVEAKDITVRGGGLAGCEIDLNATPDALPMMAVLASLAQGTTRLVNVPQARIKECDRLAVMAEELAKMGASVRELDDGLEIEGGSLSGAEVDGHGDHRIVMALAVAATAANGDTVISGAEAVGVTFPGFFDLLKGLGAEIALED